MRNSEIKSLLESTKGKLVSYSPYSFLRDVDFDRLIDDTVIEPLARSVEQGSVQAVSFTVEKKQHVFFVRAMAWDTEYFKFPIFRIEHIFYDHADVGVLSRAINVFVSQHGNRPGGYYSIDIPVEDICLLQGISGSKFKIIEPRNSYHLFDVQNLFLQGYETRLADDGDIESLKKVARTCRNSYDRVHADPAFSDEIADEYLATFLEQSVKGFADFTLVPDVPNRAAFGFLASNKPTKVCGTNVAKFVLAAIDNSVQRGWYYKLTVGQINLLKKEGADCLRTTTQASNRGSIYTWEKLGFKQHATSIVFSFRNDVVGV